MSCCESIVVRLAPDGFVCRVGSKGVLCWPVGNTALAGRLGARDSAGAGEGATRSCNEIDGNGAVASPDILHEKSVRRWFWAAAMAEAEEEAESESGEMGEKAEAACSV